MSSSKSEEVSPPQNGHAKPIPIQDIIDRLSKLLDRLSEHVSKGTKGKEIIVPQDPEDGKNDAGKSRTDSEMDMNNQLDKVCKELKYIINEFKKLKSFEAHISEPLNTLENNVDDILADRGQASTDYVKKLIERNLKVLRSNITKVKIQIPMQRQVSSTISEAHRYGQTTVASKEVGYCYEESYMENFESGSFLKEFLDHYEHLQCRQKLCLLCFSIFPENAEVKKRLLKFWWVGERLWPLPPDPAAVPDPNPNPNPDPARASSCFKQMRRLVSPKNKNPDSVPDFVKKTLQQFVEMGFIEPVTKKSRLKATNYKMHPIIRSLIIRLAKKAKFFEYDSKGNPTVNILTSKRSCLVKSEGTSWLSKYAPQLDPTQQSEGVKNQQKEKKQRQKAEDKQRIQLGDLQTLFNVSKQIPDFPVQVFAKMTSIGVLYLGRWESTAEHHMEVENTNFLKGLKNMKKLKFFSLQGISGISKLPPKSLCEVTDLRILDLRACHNLEELPKGISSLKMLTYLDLSECYLIDNMPKQLSQLSKLKVLKGFVISKNSSCTLNHLTALHNLEKLSINVNTDNFSINEKRADLIKFKALQKLKIAWGAGGQGAPTSTTENKVNNEAAKSGAMAMALQKLKKPWGACGDNKDEKAQESEMKLVKLDLQCFPGREPPWLVTEKLTSLKRLYIRGGRLSNLAESPMANKKWEAVENLRLKYLTDIKTNWKELQTQFPKLKYLEKVKCPQITFCPCDANGVWKKEP